MNDFRIDKIFLDPFIAISEDDETDVIFGWMKDSDDLPEDFYEDDEELEYVFYENNLTNTGKV